MSTTIEDLFDSIEEVASEAAEAQQLLYTVEDELLKLKRENKKLRELARQMYPSAKAFLQMGVQLGRNDMLSYDWKLQMHDLGIEVG